MASNTRSELLKTVDSQQEKIHHYEGKMKDLIAAYKSQIKENQTLKSTIQSLRLKSSSRRAAISSSQQDTDETQSDASETEGSDSPQEELHKEIERLTQSLTEMMEEKSTQQQAALVERKVLKADYEEKLKALTEELEESREDHSEAKAQYHQARSALRSEQMDRETEQSDHTSIIRELNNKLSKFMSENEDLKQQVDELTKEISIKDQQPEPDENYEQLIADLTNQVSAMRIQLKDAENRQQQQSILNDLTTEIEKMKNQHRTQVEKEQSRGDQAEARLVDVARQAESRVCELEAKLSQLSEMVGNYERLRFNDQQNINQLREKVSQLDQENTTLARVALPENDSNLSIDELSEKFKKVKVALKSACETSSLHHDYNSILSGLFADESQLHASCDSEYATLKEEYERYKLRAQSVLKTKTKESDSNKEVDDLRNQITELKDRSNRQAEKFSLEREKSQETARDLRANIATLHVQHQRDLQAAEAEYQQKLLESEQSLTKHRERTIGLLADRERHVESLQRQLDGFKGPPEGLNTDTFERLLSPTTEPTGPLLHVHAEAARHDADLTMLRRAKRDLESRVSELTEAQALNQERFQQQLGVLKQEIQRLERNQSREGTNLEYLKNVVYQFIVTPDTTSKMSIFNAISLMLHFSPHEKRNVSRLITQQAAASASYLASAFSRR